MAPDKINLKSFFLLAALAFNSLLLNTYRFDYNILTSWLRKENNPELFRNDFFINTVSKVEISWFYEIVKKISAYIDIPILFFSIHILSLFLMCLFLFRIAAFLTGNRVAAYASVLMFSMGIRQWVAGAPQIYYFFVHHSAFSLPFFLLIIALFFKERYILSFFLLGLMANFHLMFVIYVLVALSIPFLFSLYDRRLSLKNAGICIVAFIISAIPSIYHALQFSGQFVVTDEWFKVVKWTVWIHILPSKWDISIIRNFIVYILCFATAFRVYPKSVFKKNLIGMFSAIAIFCAAGTFFVEIYPISIFTQLQVWRSTWIFFILSIPVFANFIYLTWGKTLLSRFAAISTLLVYAGYVSVDFNDPRCFYETPFWMLPCFMLLCITAGNFNITPFFKKISSLFILIFSSVVMVQTLLPRFEGSFFDIGGKRLSILFLAFLVSLLFSSNFVRSMNVRGKSAVALCSMILVFAFVVNLRQGPYFPLKGYEEERRTDWIDLQFFVRDNTSKDALFIVPPYLAYPDFRFYSQRASFGDWVDGGFAIYLGSEFAREWSKRMKATGLDLKEIYDDSFAHEKRQYQSLNSDEIMETAIKYNVQYFVAQGEKELPFVKAYENDTFTLYELPKGADHKTGK